MSRAKIIIHFELCELNNASQNKRYYNDLKAFFVMVNDRRQQNKRASHQHIRKLAYAARTACKNTQTFLQNAYDNTLDRAKQKGNEQNEHVPKIKF